jgi:DUF1365 family protein
MINYIKNVNQNKNKKFRISVFFKKKCIYLKKINEHVNKLKVLLEMKQHKNLLCLIRKNNCFQRSRKLSKGFVIVNI